MSELKSHKQVTLSNPQSSGEGGIRTPGPISETQHFQCCTIGHSATSPVGLSERQTLDATGSWSRFSNLANAASQFTETSRPMQGRLFFGPDFFRFSLRHLDLQLLFVFDRNQAAFQFTNDGVALAPFCLAAQFLLGNSLRLEERGRGLQLLFGTLQLLFEVGARLRHLGVFQSSDAPALRGGRSRKFPFDKGAYSGRYAPIPQSSPIVATSFSREV